MDAQRVSKFIHQLDTSDTLITEDEFRTRLAAFLGEDPKLDGRARVVVSAEMFAMAAQPYFHDAPKWGQYFGPRMTGQTADGATL